MYNDNENHGMLDTPMVLKPTFTQFKNVKAEVIKTSDTEVTTGNVNKLPLAMRKYLNKVRSGKVNTGLRKARHAAQKCVTRKEGKALRKLQKQKVREQALVASINIR